MVNDFNKINRGYSYEVIRHPLVTEKSMKLSENNKVVMKVATFATKDSIMKAISSLFNVKVKKINIINQSGKKKVFKGHRGVRINFKKAIITLEDGQNIDLGIGV